MNNEIIEYAQLSTVQRPEDAAQKAIRYYLGNEFCDRRIVTPAEIEEAFTSVGETNGITCITPFMTNEGFGRIGKTFEVLAKKNERNEIVINDWGMLGFLRREYPHFTFILGRILVSRYLTQFLNWDNARKFKQSKETQAFYCQFPQAFIVLMKKYGIQAFEFNSFSHLYVTQKQLVENGIRTHIYFPYTYITVTRHCRFPGMYEPQPLEDVPDCHRECHERYAILSNRLHENVVLENGNARFLREKVFPQGFDHSIDRVIYNDYMRGVSSGAPVTKY